MVPLTNDFIAPTRVKDIKGVSYRGDCEIPAGVVKRPLRGNKYFLGILSIDR